MKWHAHIWLLWTVLLSAHWFVAGQSSTDCQSSVAFALGEREEELDLIEDEGVSPQRDSSFSPQSVVKTERTQRSSSKGVAQTSKKNSTRVAINSATLDELKTLPGIGEVLAGRIIASREADGPFHSQRDLERVKGIGAKTSEKIAPFIAFK